MSIMGLPPGLRGYAAQRNLQSQEQNQQLGQMQGLLGIQQAIAQRDQMAKDQEFKGLLGARLAAGDMEGAKTIAMQYKPELFAQSLVPKAPKWQESRVKRPDGSVEVGYVDMNSPTPEATFRARGVEPVKNEFVSGVPVNPYQPPSNPIPSPTNPFNVVSDGRGGFTLAPNQPVQDFQLRKAATGASRSVTNVNMPGDDKYIDTRRANDANAFKDLEKAAQSAYNQFSTLDRFIKASEKGFAGGAAPVLASVTNFLSSFGYDSESLKDTRVMEQAIGDVLGNKMAELGARGLTDKDMEILRQALPRVETDKGSRVQIAKIMQKASANVLREYENARNEEARIYPGLANRTPNPAWFKDYKSNPQRFGIAPANAGNVPAGVDPKVWAVMTPEEKALWK